MSQDVKHGGCYDCGSKEQPVLTARWIRKLGAMTAALCQKCEIKRGIVETPK